MPYKVWEVSAKNVYKPSFFVCSWGGWRVQILYLMSHYPCSTKVSVSNKVEAISGAETGDGVEGEKEVQPSMEEGLTGEQKPDDHSQLSGKHTYIHGP